MTVATAIVLFVVGIFPAPVWITQLDRPADVLHVLAWRNPMLRMPEARIHPAMIASPTFGSWFERLEQRVLFQAAPTVLDDLAPESDSNAAYVLGLAAGETNATPPQPPVSQPKQSPMGGVSAATAPADDSSGGGGGSQSLQDADTGTPTAPTTRSPGDFRYVLRPGSGFTGPTTQPDPVGYDPNLPEDQRPAGWDAKAIARWDVVPYQTFDDTFNVGVVAFHMNGIDRVEFSVNGGDWTAVRTMTLNPQTDVYEYTATLRAGDFNAGLVELRAVAYPHIGLPRVLQGSMPNPNGLKVDSSLFLNADPDSTITSNRPIRYVAPWGNNQTGDGSQGNPFATILYALKHIQTERGNCDNAVVYLAEGTYKPRDGSVGDSKPLTLNGWAEVRGAPGTDPNNVVLYGSNNSENYIGWSRCKLSHLTLRSALNSTGTNQPAAIWVADNAVLRGQNRTLTGGTSLVGFSGGAFATNCSITEVQNGIFQAVLLRNVTATAIGSDPFPSPHMLVNCTADDVDPRPDLYGELGIHPDVLVYGQPRENQIVYNLRVTNAAASLGWGQSSSNLTDLAIVNVLLESGETQVGDASYNHLLVWNVSHVLGRWRWKNSVGTTFRNLSVRNSVFSHMTKMTGVLFVNETVDNNHFCTGDPLGTGTSVGDPKWANPGVKDFRPGLNSPLRQRVVELLVPCDLAGTGIATDRSIGAYQP